MNSANPNFQAVKVAEAFDAFPDDARAGLLLLRQMIFETARTTSGVGTIEETLKWGQPSYLTPGTKSGTTLRLGVPKTGGFAIYTHCQTSVMSEFQQTFPNEFTFQGNRAVHFDSASELPIDKIKVLISRALTYHLI